MVPELQLVRMVIEAQRSHKGQKKDLWRYRAPGLAERKRPVRQGGGSLLQGAAIGSPGMMRGFTLDPYNNLA
jgi:hypothetical protein